MLALTSPGQLSDNRPVIIVSILGVKLIALIDSGASRSIISSNVVPKEVSRRRLSSPAQVSSDVNLKHGIQMILGSDFLYKCRTKICYEKLDVSFPIAVANLDHKESVSQARVPFHAFLPKNEQLENHVVINPEGIPEFVWDPIEKEAPRRTRAVKEI